MAKKVKSKLEQLVSKVPILERNGRKRIDTNLYFDFNSSVYYYFLGKDKDRKNKWYSEKDPIAMELYISDIEKIGRTESLKKSLYFSDTTI